MPHTPPRRETTRNDTAFWLLTASLHQARLLRATVTRYERLHIEPVSILDEEWEEHEHGRPSPLHGKDGRHYASVGHEDEERVRRFAKRIVGWLPEALTGVDVQTVHAFVSPRLLGELRKVLPQSLRDVWVEEALDMGHFTTAQLAEHRAIARVQARMSHARALEATLSVRAGGGQAADQLVHEHAALHGTMRGLRAQLELLGTAPSADKVGAIAQSLRAFAFHLERHFRLEEKGGLLRPLESPDEAQREVGQILRGEHRGLARELTDLVRSAERSMSAIARLPDGFRDACVEFMGDLARHESFENELARGRRPGETGPGF